MKAIRIDDEVWAALQKQAQPFEDTPNSVLRRVFHIHKVNGNPHRTKRADRGTRTLQAAYRAPILQILSEAGGSVRASEILDRLEKLMKHQLNDVDRQTLSSGAIRWKTAAQFERNKMVEEGLLKKDSPRGVWELTSKGIKATESADQS